MKKNKLYLLFVFLLVLIFIFFQVIQPKYFNWNITLDYEDKNPFGAYVLHNVMNAEFSAYEHSYHSIYELQDEYDKEVENLLIISESFIPDSLDLKYLTNMVQNGANLMIASSYFGEQFADTVGFKLEDVTNYNMVLDLVENGQDDSLSIRLVNNNISAPRKYFYPKQMLTSSISEIDTSAVSVLALNGMGEPVSISKKIGEGELFIITTPLVFTNYGMLYNDNGEFISKLLSYFDGGNVHWTEYYHTGRNESSTSLRYIIAQPPLKWALYLSLTAIVLFMIFEAKRKQRVIPVIQPLANTTVHFIQTISQLYYQKQNHRDLAWKKIIHFHEYIQNRYFINIFENDNGLVDHLSGKTGVEVAAVRKIIDKIERIRKVESIAESELVEINSLIDTFYTNKL